MLNHLTIKNIVLIDTLDIEFSSGFGVLTGETGAGKSILLSALGFVTGNKAGTGMLRSGAKQGMVTACFSIVRNTCLQNLLEENCLPNEGEIILRRIISDNGKSRAFINDARVSIGFLQQVSQYLVEVHGQHDQRGLLDSVNHREIIDQYMDEDNLLSQVADSYDEYNRLQNEIINLQELASQSASQEDYLSYVLKELESLDPKAGEETELAHKRSRMMHAEKISDDIQSAYNILTDQTIDGRISKVQNLLYKLSETDKNIVGVIESIERANIELQESASSLEMIINSLDISDESLDEIEERLFALRGAARKHNVSVDELPAYSEKLRKDLDNIQNKELHIEELSKKLALAKECYLSKSQELTKKRIVAAQQFEQHLIKELTPLKMENTRFRVNIEKLSERSWTKFGTDKIVFIASINPGSPLAPLIKIASGGELSRFMLAMKVVLSNVNSAPVLIFDEVDTGIGGAVADAVGRRMQALGLSYQVLSVTHHPQVAAYSSLHLKISKQTDGKCTTTNVCTLNGKDKSQEIARMLAGEHVTSEALAAADKLMEASKL